MLLHVQSKAFPFIKQLDEWEILEEKIKKEDAWKFKYGTKEGSVNVSAFIREKLFRERIDGTKNIFAKNFNEIRLP